MTEEDWKTAGVAALDPLCRAVGLRPVAQIAGVPAGAGLWAADYAAVLFWPGEAERLVAATTEAEAWLAEYLSNEEDRRGARVVDGYLLVALSCAVEDEHASLLRGIELSTQVCRKHVIWPDESGEWRRLDGVTVLGLPAGVTSADGEPEWPSLAGETARLWSSIQTLGPIQAAQAEERQP